MKAKVRETDFSGRAVLITGGAAGIGWATAQRFAAAGARVLIADIDADRAARRAAELGEGHGSFGVDLAEDHQVVAMVEHSVRHFGSLDILINNAGRTDPAGLSAVDQPVAAFEHLLAVNLRGSLLAAEAAAAVMRKSGGGSIVNLASGAALRPVPFRNGYSASKAGVLAMTRHHACAFAGDGIRVNAVAPGYTRTELVDELIARGRIDPAAVARRIPLGRMAVPDEIAAVIAFVASPRAAYLTGSTFLADGGSQVSSGGSGPVAPDDAGRSAPAGRPVYLVAGACNRLGESVAQMLAARDATVIPVDRDERPLSVLAAALGADHPVLSVDMLDEAGFRAGVEAVVQRVGRLDGVVNAIGAETLMAPRRMMGGAEPARSQGDDRQSFDAHLVGALRVAKAVGPTLLRQGFGVLVNLTSIDADVVLGADAGRAANAAAVAMFSRTLACEWAGHGVRVNAIAAGLFGDVPSEVSARIPLGRAASPQDTAEVAAFLLSMEAGYVTGSVIAVDGGLSISAAPDRSPLQRMPS
ncbi:SDR family oxidoreductase [Bradyrhizobium algeriense]|uniref:SDR family oxidoreductase n=1 Tax=Bradyrhizobium algeriense TaxID=634784 RepID=UPI000D335B01|nr:SDR family oxidoreductase [Bradyrhizobium algeriense]